MLSFVLAVLAAFGNATSSVLQRKANREVPRSQNLSWRLIWSLLHQPVWCGGILAICAVGRRSGQVPWYGWTFGISANLALVGTLVMLGRRESARGSGGATGPRCSASRPARRSA